MSNSVSVKVELVDEAIASLQPPLLSGRFCLRGRGGCTQPTEALVQAPKITKASGFVFRLSLQLRQIIQP